MLGHSVESASGVAGAHGIYKFLCDAITCRRKLILSEFEPDSLLDKCNNCDNCLDTTLVVQTDVTPIASQVVEALVYLRSTMRWGRVSKRHLLDFLLQKSPATIQREYPCILESPLYGAVKRDGDLLPEVIRLLIQRGTIIVVAEGGRYKHNYLQVKITKAICPCIVADTSEGRPHCNGHRCSGDSDHQT